LPTTTIVSEVRPSEGLEGIFILVLQRGADSDAGGRETADHGLKPLDLLISTQTLLEHNDPARDWTDIMASASTVPRAASAG
jgi:hypothetical protein